MQIPRGFLLLCAKSLEIVESASLNGNDMGLTARAGHKAQVITRSVIKC